MATQLEALTGEPHPDPDAQATVTDFLDYTEYLPSDLVRSLTLIGKLDESYLECVDEIHSISKTYGELPGLPASNRPHSQDLRRDISYHLDRAQSARESSYAEAARLYDAVDRHSSRLTSIISKLNALPKPPSRDPTPVPQARSPQASRTRTALKASEPTARITLHGPRPIASATDSSAQRPRQRPRKVTVPGEVLPPPNPDSPPPATDSEWESIPSPIPMPTSRVGAPLRNRPPATVRIRPPKQPKTPKEKTPRPPRPPGAMGTNVHSAVAGISTSNALSLLSPPPADAKPGSDHAPWMRLTEWEMAKLRKRMKKNAIWSPSETMIRRELADAGRGPDNYRAAKANSEATGEPFIDEDNLASQPPGRQLAPGEISADSLGFEETSLSNRGMKLNEAKKIKREAMLRGQQEQAEQLAKTEVEQAAKRLGDIGSTIKNLFFGATNLVNASTSSTNPAQAKPAEKSKEKAEKEKEKQRLKEEKAREKEKERQRELEKKESERAKALEKEEREKEQEKERQRQQELERQLESERQQQIEKERQQREEEEARAREEEKAKEAEREKEREREAAQAAAKKRKRESPPKIDVPAKEDPSLTSEPKPSPKKRRTEISTTMTIPLAAPAPSPTKASTPATPAPLITPASETRRSTRRPSLTIRGPAPPPAEPVEPSPRSATRASTRRASTGGPASATYDTRRRSTTPRQVSIPVGAAPTRRSKRSAPGNVIHRPEGGAAVSVGSRKRAPRKRGGAGAASTNASKTDIGGGSKKQKDGEARVPDDASDEEIDPNEERWCICNDVYYGEMVGCDNDEVSMTCANASLPEDNWSL